MKECPHCHQIFKNKGLAIHIKKSHPDSNKIQKVIIYRKLKTSPESIRNNKKCLADSEYFWDTLIRVTILGIIVLIGLFIYSNLDWFSDFENNEIIQIYAFVLTNLNNPASIIILLLTIVIFVAFVFLIYKGVWRTFFPDLYIKNYDEISSMINDNETIIRPIRIPKTFIGRVYLSIGIGRIDGLIRKIQKCPKPEKITIYFNEQFRPFIPFFLTSSLTKAYIYLDNKTDIRKEGLFKYVIKANHREKIFENNRIVYVFKSEGYSQDEINADWYEQTHEYIIQTGLKKVTQATLLDSTVQKDQMRNVLVWLPQEDIIEDAKIYELKLKKQKGEN